MELLTPKCISVLNLPSSDGIKDGGDDNYSILDDCIIGRIFGCNYQGRV